MKLSKKIAGCFGYELTRKKKNPSLESHLVNLLGRYAIDLVLDVGANQGQFGRMVRQLGYRGEIHSFEPVAATFDKLQASATGDPGWHLHRIGLGECEKRVTINVTQSSDLSSILAPNDFGKEKYRQMAVDHQEEIHIRTLDSLVDECGLRGWRIFLKMDTQGYDLNVFAGAAGSLDSICCLLSELSITPIYSGMPDYQTALRTYEGAGFQISGIYPVSRNKDLSIIEMDCCLVRRGSLPPAA